jgi:ABC-type nitrate/sulfonate/bicarbonate transport system ATPase subunit
LELWEKDRKTVVMVTHDVDEALYLADRVVLMTDGPEAHLGLDIAVNFERPRNRYEVQSSAEYAKLHKQILHYLESHTKQFAA